MLAHMSLRHLTLALQLLVGVALLSFAWLSDETDSSNSVSSAKQTIESLKSHSGQC